MTTLITRLVAIIILLLVARSALAAVILQYHHVSADSPAATSVTPKQFEQHLERLSEAGFRVMPLDELVKAVREGLDPEERVAAITFDDGYRSVYETALPMLEARGWTATLFVNTAGIREGWQGMMTLPMLIDARKQGHLVANHTQSHPHMVRRRDGESVDAWRSRMREEILTAQKQLEDWLGEGVPAFLAWPFGEYTPALQELAAELGFTAFGQQTGAVVAGTDWQQAPRVSINRHYGDWRDLKDKVMALPLPVKQIEPENGVTRLERPQLTLTLQGDWLGRLNCFAGGQPADIDARQTDGLTVFRVRSRTPLVPGRHRYNCTAAAGADRFYWYSFQWMRRQGESWYAEP